MRDVELQVALAKLSVEIMSVGEKVDRVYTVVDRLEQDTERRVSAVESRIKTLGGIYIGISATLAIIGSALAVIHFF